MNRATATLLALAPAFGVPGCGNKPLADRGTPEAAAKGEQSTGTFVVNELRLKRKDLSIFGQIYLPGDGAGIYPTVIIGHEYGADHNSVAQYAEIFAKAGFAAYVFDFCGGGSTSRSDGTLLEMSVMTEVADMKAVLDQILAQNFVDRKNVFLMGASQGGLVAALTAAERAADLKALILYYPALVIPDNARARFSSVQDIPERNDNLGIIVGRPYFADVLNLQVYNTIGAFTKDVLIIHGDSDRLVPIAGSERAINVYPSATLIPIEGADHVFHGKHAVQAGLKTVDFLQAHLNLR